MKVGAGLLSLEGRFGIGVWDWGSGEEDWRWNWIGGEGLLSPLQKEILEVDVISRLETDSEAFSAGLIVLKGEDQ